MKTAAACALTLDCAGSPHGAEVHLRAAERRVCQCQPRLPAPPTFNDVFDPLTSASRDLDASNAIICEVGFRANPYEWLLLDGSLFRIYFEDQVVISQNVAGNFDTRSQGAEGTAEIGLFGLLRHLASAITHA